MTPEKGSAFQNAVAAHIGPLMQGLGFQHVRSSAQDVVFESNEMLIDIYREERSGEIGLAISFKRLPSEEFSLSELLRYLKYPEAEKYRNYMAISDASVHHGMINLRKILDQINASAFLPDRELFEGLLLQREKIADKRALDSRYRRARELAAKAWEEKRYDRVVLALMDLHKDLTEVERKRLEFAKKQLRSR